ncbi:MAG TPA: aldolase/citrate lyase family protein [Thermoplasmataceae archaeon]|nr:hypothetical protein [Thermoplasmatales archaeon AK]HLH86576.1 aldolase/citrate lyase family protein [Thermoplasmataceae archaeon]
MIPDIDAFKQRLRESRNLIAPLVTISDPGIAEIFSQAEPDFLIVDMEHSVLEVKDLQGIVTAVGNLPVVARVKGADRTEIKRVLDTGVVGIIIPAVRDFQEAQEAVSMSVFPPNGIRGAGPGRASGYGLRFSEYKSTNPAVILQIETDGAYEDIEKIARLEHLDGLFIGPMDLTLSLGIEMEWKSPRFQSTIRKVFETANLLNKPCGIYCPLDEVVIKELRNFGFSFFMFGMDKEAIRSYFSGFIRLARKGEH